MLRFSLTIIATLLLVSPAFADGNGNGNKNTSVSEAKVAETVTKPFFTQLLTSFTATAQEPGTVQLQWSSTPQKKGLNYLVERSDDGQSFVTITTLPAHGSRFLFLDDRQDAVTPVYYRISVQKGNASQPVSHTISVGGPVQRPIRMSAEEVNNGQLQLNIFTNTAASGALKIMNSKGDLVRQKDLILFDGYNRIVLSDCNQLQSGDYYLTLQTETGLSALKFER